MSALNPDVPNVPGVPPVFRDASNPSTPTAVPALTQDTVTPTGAGRVSWGIFDQSGNIALACDNVMALEPSREFRTSDYPVQQGGFQSYNKVAVPGETRITVTKGGALSDQTAFMNTLDTMVESTMLYSLVSPILTFQNRNLIKYDYRQTAENGATLLTVEIQTIEIRETATAAFSDSKNPSGASTSDNGPVQPIDDPASIDQAMAMAESVT